MLTPIIAELIITIGILFNLSKNIKMQKDFDKWNELKKKIDAEIIKLNRFPKEVSNEE